MKTPLHFYMLLLIGLLLSAGCSAFPGLRVLTGQDTPQTAAEQVIEQTDLVMGDKAGTLNPSLSAAADRIEKANGSAVDIVQIGKDTNADAFVVAMLWLPQGWNEAPAVERNDMVRRLAELTWQGVLQESLTSDVLLIQVLQPLPVTTLDSGDSFTAYTWFTIQIARSDAVAYLAHRPNTVQDFATMVVDGKLQYNSPNETQFYTGHPNHPVWMLSALQANSQNQDSG